METLMEDMATAEAGAEPAMEVALLVSGSQNHKMYILIFCLRGRNWRQDEGRRGPGRRGPGRHEGAGQARRWRRQTLLEGGTNNNVFTEICIIIRGWHLFITKAATSLYPSCNKHCFDIEMCIIQC